MKTTTFRVPDKYIESVLKNNFNDENEEPDELGKILGIGVDDSQESNKIPLAEGNSNTFPHKPNNLASPELSYTPGKSRLDKDSMARLKVCS